MYSEEYHRQEKLPVNTGLDGLLHDCTVRFSFESVLGTESFVFSFFSNSAAQGMPIGVVYTGKVKKFPLWTRTASGRCIS